MLRYTTRFKFKVPCLEDIKNQKLTDLKKKINEPDNPILEIVLIKACIN